MRTDKDTLLLDLRRIADFYQNLEHLAYVHDDEKHATFAIMRESMDEAIRLITEHIDDKLVRLETP